jgi:hypothetical protein
MKPCGRHWAQKKPPAENHRRRIRQRALGETPAARFGQRPGAEGRLKTGVENSSDLRIERRVVDSRAAASVKQRSCVSKPYRGKLRQEGRRRAPETQTLVPETASRRPPSGEAFGIAAVSSPSPSPGAMNCPAGQEREGRWPLSGRAADTGPSACKVICGYKVFDGMMERRRVRILILPKGYQAAIDA